MLVKYACQCDHCSKRSPEYTAWPKCRECGDDVCDACRVRCEDDEETNSSLCIQCDKLKNDELYKP
jgi:hypothetical protein